MERPKADSFTTYLEEKQRAAASAQKAPGGTPLTVVLTLADAPERQMPLTELMRLTGLALVDFAEAVKTLSDSGYITVKGSPGSEVAGLTNLGQVLAQMARAK
jgi:predicted transcriptional regulator